MSFAEDLKALRVIRKLTQTQLAALAVTSQAFISHIEQGKLLPSPDLKKRLRKALKWGPIEDKAFELLNQEGMITK